MQNVCFAGVSFLYINGSNNNDEKSKVWFENGSEKLHPAVKEKFEKNPEIIDLGLIGVLPEYQMRGISSALINEILKMLENGKVKYAETNLNLEDNYNIQNQWKAFDSVLHKRRRCYVKKID